MATIPARRRWWHILADWCERHGRKRVIMDHMNNGVEYMHRYYLIGGPEHRWFYLALHHVLIGDGDGLHDHPNAYLACILDGGYHERTPAGTFERRPGSIRFRSARSFHRLELRKADSWSLFLAFPRTRNWGFLVGRKWVSHQKHLGEV